MLRNQAHRIWAADRLAIAAAVGLKFFHLLGGFYTA